NLHDLELPLPLAGNHAKPRCLALPRAAPHRPPIEDEWLQGGGQNVAQKQPQEQSNHNERKGLSLIITVICCYIAISTLLQTKDEFRFIIPYVEFSKQVKGAKSLVLDTSVIIDGRIADICDTRFIDTKLIVPRFVLQELQSVADSSDKLKRNRGRRGLDMLKRMQNNPKVELQMHEANLAVLRDVHKVDERLVVLAKALDARVVTNDYNLNKIAQLQGVEVINLNELANSLKSVALPGEMMTVRVVKAGDQIGQGVGYLEDGTMVVIEHGRSMIGQEAAITVTSVLQTPAGRMIFGRLEGRPQSVTN
ncbi:MAG: PIN/TRAM domain-containing protein, partial [Gemmataceae bacterium]